MTHCRCDSQAWELAQKGENDEEQFKHVAYKKQTVDQVAEGGEAAQQPDHQPEEEEHPIGEDGKPLEGQELFEYKSKAKAHRGSDLSKLDGLKGKNLPSHHPEVRLRDGVEYIVEDDVEIEAPADGEAHEEEEERHEEVNEEGQDEAGEEEQEEAEEEEVESTFTARQKTHNQDGPEEAEEEAAVEEVAEEPGADEEAEAESETAESEAQPPPEDPAVSNYVPTPGVLSEMKSRGLLSRGRFSQAPGMMNFFVNVTAHHVVQFDPNAVSIREENSLVSEFSTNHRCNKMPPRYGPAALAKTPAQRHSLPELPPTSPDFNPNKNRSYLRQQASFASLPGRPDLSPQASFISAAGQNGGHFLPQIASATDVPAASQQRQQQQPSVNWFSSSDPSSRLLAAMPELETLPLERLRPTSLVSKLNAADDVLEHMVTPVLRETLRLVNEERPDDPLLFMGKHLINVRGELPQLYRRSSTLRHAPASHSPLTNGISHGQLDADVLQVQRLWPTSLVKSLRSMPNTRDYLEATVLPLLRDALHAANEKRPEDPLFFVGRYLIESRPHASQLYRLEPSIANQLTNMHDNGPHSARECKAAARVAVDARATTL